MLTFFNSNLGASFGGKIDPDTNDDDDDDDLFSDPVGLGKRAEGSDSKR